MKKVLFAVMVLVMIFVAAGCGEEGVPPTGTDSSIDPAALSKYISENVTFKDHMDVVDNDILFEVYGIDPAIVKDACSYFSTGATAEEITVVITDDIEAVMTAYSNRIESQTEGFENYVPEELTKLAVPFKLVNDDAVIMVVCDDTKEAETAVNSYVDDLNNN